MRKWVRNLLKILGVIGIIIIAVLIYAISFIDHTPYFETEYYSNTVKSLNEAIANRIKTEGNFKAGFSKINITPKIVEGRENPGKGEFNHIKLAGFGDGKMSVGTHDSIYAKAIAIEVGGEKLILVSADVLLMPPAVAEIVGENLETYSDLDRKQIIFGATHTHTSSGNCMPGFIGKQFGGEFKPEFVKWLSEKYTKLIQNAVADIKAAEFATDYIHVPKLVKNRMIGKTGRLNDKLTLLSISQENGKKAVAGIYAAHATSLGSDTDLFSGDYPGYFQRTLENNGIDMAMFFAGTVGSHTNKGKGSKYDKSKYIGVALADSAQVILKKMEYSSRAKFSMVTTEIVTPDLQFLYISDNLRLSPAVGEKLMKRKGKIYLQGFKLNNLIWIAMPYELSGEYAIDLKNALEVNGFNSAMTSFNGQYLGYIVPSKYYYYDAYESRLMGWYGPSMGDYLMELHFTLANGLTEKRL